MCPPKVPAPSPIPDRQAARLPDQGDPAVRALSRSKKFATQAMTISTQSTLGAPAVSGNPNVLGV